MIDEEYAALMDRWLRLELEAAPRLEATTRVREALARRRRGTAPRPARWLAAALVAASLVALVLLRPAPVEEFTSVGVHAGWRAEMATGPRGGPGGRGGRGQKGPLAQVQLDHYRIGTTELQRVDLAGSTSSRVTLTKDDDFCLFVRTSVAWHLHAYHRDAGGRWSRLFPGTFGESLHNPLQPDQLHRLPDDSRWLHLRGRAGEERLWVVLTPAPRPECESLYRRYRAANDPGRRRELALALNRELQALVEEPDEQGAAFSLTIEHR